MNRTNTLHACRQLVTSFLISSVVASLLLTCFVFIEISHSNFLKYFIDVLHAYFIIVAAPLMVIVFHIQNRKYIDAAMYSLAFLLSSFLLGASSLAFGFFYWYGESYIGMLFIAIWSFLPVYIARILAQHNVTYPVIKFLLGFLGTFFILYAVLLIFKFIALS